MNWGNFANEAQKEIKAGKYLKLTDLGDDESYTLRIVGDEPPEPEEFTRKDGTRAVSYKLLVRQWGKEEVQECTLYPREATDLGRLCAEKPPAQWDYRVTRVGKRYLWEAVDPAGEDDDTPF
jgi:hypothetical protein